MTKLKPATPDNAIQLDNALAALRKSLVWCKGADCPQTANAIRRAIKSAEGAKRHMYRRVSAGEG